jgi:hypothetical protein
MAGWGRLNNNSSPRILQTASAKLLTNYECENRLLWQGGLFVWVHERNLCSAAVPYVLLHNVRFYLNYIIKSKYDFFLRVYNHPMKNKTIFI